ncbi:MAG: YARHG domain-containing protein [Bacteroidales bacterium]|jgi:hypothetical protein|nr:YARHG domain-containing protein [Bacteroidales bacterium]
MKKFSLLVFMAFLTLTMQAQGIGDWRQQDMTQRYQLLRIGDYSSVFWSTTTTWHDGKSCYIMQPANAPATKVLLTRVEVPSFQQAETMTIKVNGEKATCKGKKVTHETLGTWDMLVFRDGKGNIRDVLLRVEDNSQEAMERAIAHDAEVAEEGYPEVDGLFGLVSVRPMTRGILERYSKEDLRLMQWEIYARHNAPIPDPRYWDYFDRQPWYNKNAVNKTLLSDLEFFNISLIKTIESGKK